MARVILDTGVVIRAARQELDVAVLARQGDVALPAIVLAEFLAGIELDPNRVRAERERTLLDWVFAVTVVEDYTTEVAHHHAELLAHDRRAGRPRGAHDLIIAATARARGRVLLTTDRKAAFQDLPGVEVRAL
jgi:tRNA(fMet)-specific endonuclease VapC